MSINQNISKLGATFRSDKIAREIDDEIQTHIEMETDENVEGGMKPDEARQAAHRSVRKRGARAGRQPRRMDLSLGARFRATI